MAEDRIAQLSQRFRKHTLGRTTEGKRTRERQSFYLDMELVKRLDTVYRDVNHELYPRNVSKSTFLETLIQHGLDRMNEWKSVLAERQELQDTSTSA